MPSEKYSLLLSSDMLTNGSTAIEWASVPASPATGSGRVFQYQPAASAASTTAAAITRLLPAAAPSTLMPAGVTSNTHASTSAIGKPSMMTNVISRGAHSGRLSCGATVEATWISSQPTTR